jgi:CrcB protein
MGLDGRELAAVFVGGALGAVTRALVAELGSGDPSAWPWTTFAVNLVGAALLAYFATRLQERLPLSSYRRPLVGTGLCGGLTTFSTMQVEVIDMIDHGSYALAASYALVSTLAGLLVVVLATGAVRRVRVR